MTSLIRNKALSPFLIFSMMTGCNFCALEEVLPKRTSMASFVNATDTRVWLSIKNTNVDSNFNIEAYINSGGSTSGKLIFGSNEEDYDPIFYYLTEVCNSQSIVHIHKPGHDTLSYTLDLDLLESIEKGFFAMPSWEKSCDQYGNSTISYTIEESDFK